MSDDSLLDRRSKLAQLGNCHRVKSAYSGRGIVSGAMRTTGGFREDGQ
jgi:hypothetical protein